MKNLDYQLNEFFYSFTTDVYLYFLKDPHLNLLNKNSNIKRMINLMKVSESLKKLVITSPDTSIGINSNREDFINKLKDFLSISYDVIDPLEIQTVDWDIDINFVQNFNLPEYLQDGETHEIEHGELALKIIRAEGLYIWKSEEFWLLKRGNKIYIEGMSQEIIFQITRKTIRQIFTFRLEYGSGLRLHASSCSTKNGKGVAFIGHKGAGKTTTLLSLLSYEGYSYITNDLLEVRNRTESLYPHIKGWPTVCLIGRGTLNSIYKYRYLLPDEDHCLDERKPKIQVQINEIEDKLGAKLLSSATFNSIFFTKLNLSVTGTNVTKISRTEGLELIKEHVINQDKDHPDWLHLRGENDNKVDVTNLLSNINFYNIEIGNDLKEAARVIDTCLNEEGNEN